MTSNLPAIALVTGAGRGEGIGFEVCRQLAAAGVTVILSARRSDAAEALAASLAAEGLDVQAQQLDVTSPASVGAARDSIRDRFGQLDILVNNAAGAAHYGETVAAADLDQARAMFETVVFGSWSVTQAMLQLLRRSPHPRIVNVSSGAGSHGDSIFGLATENAMGPSYAAAKAALNALTVRLAVESSGTAMRVNAVCPGLTATFPGAAGM